MRVAQLEQSSRRLPTSPSVAEPCKRVSQCPRSSPATLMPPRARELLRPRHCHTHVDTSPKNPILHRPSYFWVQHQCHMAHHLRRDCADVAAANRKHVRTDADVFLISVRPTSSGTISYPALEDQHATKRCCRLHDNAAQKYDLSSDQR